MKDWESLAAQDQIDVSKVQAIAIEASHPAVKGMLEQIIEIERGMAKYVRPIIEERMN